MVLNPRTKLTPLQAGAVVVAGVTVVAYLVYRDTSPAKPAPAKQPPAASCMKDLQCWGDKGSSVAASYCEKRIERLATHSVRWTEGAFGVKFSRFRWKDQARGVVTFIGDRAEFQNGFGAYTPVVYECDFDQATKAVLGVRAEEGRLPP